MSQAADYLGRFIQFVRVRSFSIVAARSGATTVIRTVLTDLLEVQPPDPIAYICDYLSHLQSEFRTFPIHHAFLQCNLFHWSTPAFWEKMASAYENMSLKQNDGKKLILELKTFTVFLNYYLEPYEKLRSALKILIFSWTEQDTIVPFEVFAKGTLLISILNDYMEKLRTQLLANAPNGLISITAARALFEKVSMYQEDIIGDSWAKDGMRAYLHVLFFAGDKERALNFLTTQELEALLERKLLEMALR
ncbi:hypothetical protein HK101_002997 [Irineochytrium annulatum]|nr:hypothetical protein HK101_002997 [Irineochytrium annulatum]